MEILRTLTIFGFVWLFYLVPAGVLSLPLWIGGRRRARWLWWEFSILLLPFLVFVSLHVLQVRGGIGWSLLFGSFYLGCIAPVAALIRVIAGQRVNRLRLASSLLIAACLIAVAVYLLLPIQGMC